MWGENPIRILHRDFFPIFFSIYRTMQDRSPSGILMYSFPTKYIFLTYSKLTLKSDAHSNIFNKECANQQVNILCKNATYGINYYSYSNNCLELYIFSKT